MRSLKNAVAVCVIALFAGCDGGAGAGLDDETPPEIGSDIGAEVAVDVDADGDAEVSADADADADAGPLPRACNGHAALCDRAFSAVSFATSHNAMSSADDDWLFPNQGHDLSRQLDDGVRGFMLDTHDDKGVAMLCHGTCLAGSEPLDAGLARFTAFLDTHPDEVIAFIFEAYISADATVEAFETAGLIDRVHVQDPKAPWPTLAALLDAGTPLVVFTDNPDSGPAWYHRVWDHAFETDYANKTKADLDCRKGRGSADSPLFILNHFLTNPVALPELAEQINHNPFFMDKASECAARWERVPTFVTVDFYDIGDVFGVVDAFNGVAAAPGRRRPGAGPAR
ncbi:MAG: hypothetical protein R3F39_21385 [Myxococcota bacterium]